jgi:hypothetical protein
MLPAELGANIWPSATSSKKRLTLNTGHEVAEWLVVKALCYKPEGRGFEIRRDE